jgi:hypothetical protein
MSQVCTIPSQQQTFTHTVAAFEAKVFPYKVQLWDVELARYQLQPGATEITKDQLTQQEIELSRLLKITGASVFDVTNEAVTILKSSYGENALVQNIRIFLPGIASMNAPRYLWGPIDSDITSKIALFHENQLGVERRFIGKIMQRELAREIGIFKQPIEWHDLRSLRLEQEHTIRFSKIDFSNLPVEELFAQGANVNVILFDDVDNGFALVRDGNHCVKLLSHNQGIHDSAAFQSGLFNSPAEIRQFLTKLSQSFVLEKYAYNSDYESSEPIVQAIKKLADGTWYLKSNFGTLAEKVVKLSLLNGKIVSSERPKAIERQTQEQSYHLARTSPEERVRNLLSGRLDSPFIEREVDSFAISKETKAEPRAVFAVINGKPVLLFIISKKSNDNVAANLAQGGVAESIEATIVRIAKENQCLGSMGLNEFVEKEIINLTNACNRFAVRFFELLNEKDLPKMEIFSLDLIPDWNNDENCIDYWLVEVQDFPDVSGALTTVSQAQLDYARRLYPNIRFNLGETM